MDEKRSVNKQMAESLILARLHKDGFFIFDEEKKTVEVDMRWGHITKLYKEGSYDDIRDIMQRTVKGLEMAGYQVTVRCLDEVGLGVIDELQNNGFREVKRIEDDVQGKGLHVAFEDERDVSKRN